MESAVASEASSGASGQAGAKDWAELKAIAVPDCPGCADLLSELRPARTDLGVWRSRHQKAVEREQQLKRELEEVRAKLSLRERQLFGRKSEQGSKGDGEGHRQENGDDTPKQKRKRGQQPDSEGHGRRRHEHLEAREEVRDVLEEDQRCRCCGLPWEEFPGTEDSEVVEVEVRAYRRKIKRKRYKRTCRCPDGPRIITAPAPPKLIPKGAYGVSFWVLVLIDKFLFQRPTHRLLADYRLTRDFDVSQGTVTDGLARLAPVFEPLYDAIKDRCVSGDRWHADETRWLVFEEVVGKVGYRWFLWLFRSEAAVAFVLDPSRSSQVPKDFFGDEATGILNVDRYVAYKVLAEDNDGRITLAFCWAHVRRDFLAVAKDWPEQENWAFEWVSAIGKLYALNAERLLALDDQESFNEAQDALCEAVEAMAQDRDHLLAEPELHPARRKVLESLERHWPGLTVFVDHPDVPMDNNQAERDVRNPVTGRKVYYGSGACWAGRLAMMLFSIFQTLLLWKINPRTWLTSYLEACALNGGQAPLDPTAFLPWNLSKEQQCQLEIRENDTS